MIQGKKISIVIPVYNVGDQIIGLIEKIPSFVDQIYVVDDKCPMNTGKKCEKLNHNNNKIIINYYTQPIDNSANLFIYEKNNQLIIIIINK